MMCFNYQSVFFLKSIYVVVLTLNWMSDVTGQTLVWSDEFESAVRTRLNAQYWSYATGDGSNSSNPGWGNTELQYYTDSDENVVVDGEGHLVITAAQIEPGTTKYDCYYGECRYTSARVFTKLARRYGRYEARLKTPAGQGLWPAFWMLGHDIGDIGWPRCGEIDIMELRGSRPDTISGALHGPGYSGGRSVSHSYTLPNNRSFDEDFHVFAVDWLPDSITWSVDGVAYNTRNRSDFAKNPWVFDRPFFILLNFAVGGHFDGNPDEDTEFPQQFVVDYVRVYDLGGLPKDAGNATVNPFHDPFANLSSSTKGFSNCAFREIASKAFCYVMLLSCAWTFLFTQRK